MESKIHTLLNYNYHHISLISYIILQARNKFCEFTHNFVVRSQRMLGIPIFPFCNPWRRLIFWFGHFSHLVSKTHTLSTSMPKISFQSPLFTEKFEKKLACAINFLKCSFPFFLLLTSWYSWISPTIQVNAINISNNDLNHSSESQMYTSVLRPYNFSKMSCDQFELNGINSLDLPHCMRCPCLHET